MRFLVICLLLISSSAFAQDLVPKEELDKAKQELTATQQELIEAKKATQQVNEKLLNALTPDERVARVTKTMKDTFTAAEKSLYAIACREAGGNYKPYFDETVKLVNRCEK